MAKVIVKNRTDGAIQITLSGGGKNFKLVRSVPNSAIPDVNEIYCENTMETMVIGARASFVVEEDELTQATVNRATGPKRVLDIMPYKS